MWGDVVLKLGTDAPWPQRGTAPLPRREGCICRQEPRSETTLANSPNQTCQMCRGGESQLDPATPGGGLTCALPQTLEGLCTLFHRKGAPLPAEIAQGPSCVAAREGGRVVSCAKIRKPAKGSAVAGYTSQTIWEWLKTCTQNGP